MNEPIIATKNDLTDEDFQHMDKLDEEQILAELTGEHITKYVYDYVRAGKRVLGVTYAGIKKWSEHRPIDLDIYRWNETEEYLSVVMVAYHLELGIKRFGTATVSKSNKDRNGQLQRDWFAETKATSKAQRNALKQFMDEPTVEAMIESYLISLGELSKPPQPGIISKSPQPVLTPLSPSERSEQPVKPDLKAYHKAYADSVSEKAEWRTRCFDMAKHIVVNQHHMECGQDAFDEAFRQYENVVIEEANVERLTDWLAYLSSPQGSQYIVEFCRNFYDKLAQKHAAEIQEADWLEKCLYKARELGFDAEIHNEAYFRRASHNIGDATAEQLEAWYAFLETFGEEYLQRIAADLAGKPAPFSIQPQQESPDQSWQPSEKLMAEDKLQLQRVCASIRLLWAKLPDYNNAKHKINSIRQHIGDYQPNELSRCGNLHKLHAYENYLKGQLPKV